MERYRPFPRNAASDLLYGAAAIADFLGITERACRYRIAERQIPVFKIGGTICSRRKTLEEWMDAQMSYRSDPPV